MPKLFFYQQDGGRSVQENARFWKGRARQPGWCFLDAPIFGQETLKQSQIIRQENDLTDDDWQKRRNQITAEHRLENARDQLMTEWKAWIKKDAFKASSQAGPGASAVDQAIPEYDE